MINFIRDFLQLLFLGAGEADEPTIFKSYQMRNHPQIGMVGRSPSGDALALSRYNPYSKSVEKEFVPFPAAELSALFAPHPMNGHTFRVSCMPFGYLTGADEIKDPVSPRKHFTNYHGFQVCKAASE